MNSPFGVPGPAFPVFLDGQCRLAKSGSNLVLSRLNGRYLWVGHSPIIIPADGITIKPTGLANSTLYYVYLRPDGTGFLSTTSHAADPLTGFKTKSNDPMTRLVGMARTTSGGAFADTATQRFTRSYFNDPGITLTNSFTTTRSVSSATLGEINSEIRIEAAFWSDDLVFIGADGSASNNGTGPVTSQSIGIDDVTAEATNSNFSAVGSGSLSAVSNSLTTTLSEGYHYITLLGSAAAGTSSWNTTATLRAAARRCVT